MQFRSFVIAVASSAALFAGSAWAATLPGSVVDTQWLAKNLDQVQIVDVRLDKDSFTAQPTYETGKEADQKMLSKVGGHIANAMLVPYRSIRGERVVDGQKIKYLLPQKADFETLMQSAGLQADRPIVIVSEGMTAKQVNAGLRLYWQLKYYGEDQIAVLDGGMAAWLGDGHKIAVNPTPKAAGDWKATAARNELVATPEDVSKADSNVQLVDARKATQFYGIDKRDYVSATGHIKGAKMLPTEVLFRKDGQAVKFYSPETYRSILAISDVKADQPTIYYCNSGHYASGPWFIEHALMDNKQARLFDGSMHQWTLQKRPVETAMLQPLPATCSSEAQTPGC